MIVLTGATGTIGSEVAALLSADRVAFRAIVRDVARAREKLGDGPELVHGDLSRPETLPAALEGADRLLVLTAPSDQLSELEAHLVDAAVDAGVSAIVKVSAQGAAVGSPFRLGDEHGRSEAHVRATGVPATFLRPASFMQNLLMHVPTVVAGGVIYAPFDEGAQPFVDARDVAAAAVEVLRNPAPHRGQAYTLTGPRAATMVEVVQALGGALGREITYVPVTPEQAGAAMRGNGLPDWLTEDLLWLAERVAEGKAGETSGDAERLLRRPPRGLDVFFRDYAPAFTAPA